MKKFYYHSRQTKIFTIQIDLIYYWSNIWNKQFFFFFLKEVAYTHYGCIYLIKYSKTTTKTSIL